MGVEGREGEVVYNAEKCEQWKSEKFLWYSEEFSCGKNKLAMQFDKSFYDNLLCCDRKIIYDEQNTADRECKIVEDNVQIKDL